MTVAQAFHDSTVKNVDRVKAIIRYTTMEGDSKLTDLAAKTGVTEGRLLNIMFPKHRDTHPDVVALVKDNQIGLTAGWVIGKLPKDEQLDWVERAKAMSLEAFFPEIASRCKEIRAGKRELSLEQAFKKFGAGYYGIKTASGEKTICEIDESGFATFFSSKTALSVIHCTERYVKRINV